MRRTVTMCVVVISLGILATGCSNKKLLKEQEAQIASLEGQVDSLSTELSMEKARAERLNEELARSLSEYRAKEQVWMEEKEGLTRITLDGEVTFASGSARISETGQSILSRIWDVLGNYPDRDVLVEGHTDNVPISPQFQDHYRSNWELSSARAHAVLHYATSKYNADPTRMAAVGYGEYRPIASNETEQGRATNRRVVITIGPRSKMPKAMP